VPAEARGQALKQARFTPLFWSAAALILVLDLWSKWYVFERLLGVDPASITTMEQMRDLAWKKREFFGGRITFVALLNPGMMWGAFHDYPQVLKAVRPLAVLVIFLLLASLPAGQWSSRLALGGILGGAIGNIYDSFRYPLGVRDFFSVDLDFKFFDPFPAFNVADSAICVGVAVLALGMMRSPKAVPSGNVPER
jgi:signal peptidase II